jgi:hypothetical protein
LFREKAVYKFLDWPLLQADVSVGHILCDLSITPSGASFFDGLLLHADAFSMDSPPGRFEK